jgi:four helix bundle protein
MDGGAAIEKSKRFAVRIVGLYKYLIREHKEFVMGKQILRSGTSVGANLAEARYAISRRDFLAKKFIALKECSETEYWLELLRETGFISDPEFASLSADCKELLKILIATVKKTRTNNEEGEEGIGYRE